MIPGLVMVVAAVLPDVGSRFVAPPGAERGLCMVSPAQLDPCVLLTVDSVRYRVAFRRRDNVVSYISTSDPEFVGPGGLRVGDLLERGPNELRRSFGFEVIADEGEPHGWRPVVGFNDKVEYGGPDKKHVVIQSFSVNESPRTARRNLEGRCECQSLEPGREHFRGWMQQERQRAVVGPKEIHGRATVANYGVNGAFVEILRNQKRVAAGMTDRDGKFCLRRLKRGHYLMVVSNPGFERQEVDLEAKRGLNKPLIVELKVAQ